MTALPPHLLDLKTLLESINGRQAEANAKVEQIGQRLDHIPQEDVLRRRAAIIEICPVIVAELSTMRLDAEKIKADDVVALYCAQGLPTNEAIDKAKQKVQGLIEDLLGIEKDGRHLRRLWNEALYLSEGETGSVLWTRGMQSDSLHKAYHCLVERMRKEMVRTQTMAERFYPHLTSTWGKSQAGIVVHSGYVKVMTDSIGANEIIRILSKRMSNDSVTKDDSSHEATQELTTSPLEEILEKHRKTEAEVGDFERLISEWLEEKENFKR